MILEFQTRKDDITQKKIKRFKELNSRYFMDNLTENEEIELNNIANWLKIHN